MSPERKARSSAYGTAGKMADAATPHVRTPYVSSRRSSGNRPGRINLKAVAEVLEAKGYDPTEEIIKLLTPPTDAEGNPVLDTHGKPVGPPVDADVRARMWNELLQYTQAKLKSVDVKVRGAVTNFDVTNEQARKIAEEFLRGEEEDE